LFGYGVFEQVRTVFFESVGDGVCNTPRRRALSVSVALSVRVVPALVVGVPLIVIVIGVAVLLGVASIPRLVVPVVTVIAVVAALALLGVRLLGVVLLRIVGTRLSGITGTDLSSLVAATANRLVRNVGARGGFAAGQGRVQVAAPGLVVGVFQFAGVISYSTHFAVVVDAFGGGSVHFAHFSRGTDVVLARGRPSVVHSFTSRV
jgi:hypothetical protein